MKHRQAVTLPTEILQTITDRAKKYKRSIAMELAFLVESGLKREEGK